MTITRQDYYIEYEITSADAGRVEFPFSFPVKEASQIYCFDIENVAGGRMETPIPPSGYLVTAAPDGFPAGGKVTLVSPLSVGHILRIERITPLTQLKVFRNQRDIDPAEVEDALDRLAMAQQEEAGEGDGAVDPEVVAQLQEDVYNLEANKADKSDPRFIDARTPTAHKATHATGGSDAITPASIGAVATTDSRLSNARTPTAHAVTHGSTGADPITPADIGAVATTDPRLDNARTPTAHASSHLPGGADALPVASGGQAGLSYGDGVTITNGPGGRLTAVGGGGGGDGTFDHRQLTQESREAADQHPQAAITGLADALATKSNTADVNAALAAKAPLASPALTGTPTAPTAETGTNNTQIATTAFVKAQGYVTTSDLAGKADAADVDTALATKAPLASPALTGTPRAPTPATATNTTQIATTAYVKGQGYAIQVVGDIRLWPHRADELPAGWHFCNGGGYSTSSAAGLALAALSENFKSDWGISVSGTTIYLPNLFSGTDGYFFRSVDGSSRLPGNKQGDAGRNITGYFSGYGTSVFGPSAGGACYPQSGPNQSSAYPFNDSTLTGYDRVYFDASRVVPTATENRPINIGMTPAIYLGV